MQVADQIWLVVSTPLKNMSSSLGIILPNIWQSKKCSKPPTSSGCPFGAHELHAASTAMDWLLPGGQELQCH